MRTAFAFLLGLLFFSCGTSSISHDPASCADSLAASKLPEEEAVTTTPASDSSSNTFSAQTFKNTPGEGPEGYGFDIYQNGKVLIHQNAIPAIQGNKAFVSEAEAKAVGSLMLYKISNGIMPPTVDIKELDSLKIRY